MALLACAAVSSGGGCTGSILGDGTGNPQTLGTGGPTPGLGGTPAVPPGAAGSSNSASSSVGAAPLRRLTDLEYRNTVRDLLGDENAGAALTAVAAGRHQLTAQQPIAGVEVERYRNAAEKLSADAVAGHLSTLVPCKPAKASEEPACARTFIEQFGRRAFRRPLATAEADSLESLYTWARTQAYDFTGGVRVVLQAMLQDPRFLMLPERGERPAKAVDEIVPLSPHEIAARLSYALWRSMPDDALFAAADGGQLATAEQVRAQAERLLRDSRSASAVDQLTNSWLGLDVLPSVSRTAAVYADWSPALTVAMRLETEQFVRSVLLEGDGRVETLLTASYSFLDAPLAKLYGASAPAGSGLQRTQLPPERAGLLTQASFLTLFYEPIRRGKFVREQLLCQKLPPPPANAASMGGKVPESATQRERVEAHSADPVCRGCHELLDPVGLGFSAFDNVGHYAGVRDGAPVDSSGRLAGVDADIAGPFDGAAALARKLATSPTVGRCLTASMFRAALNRDEAPEDAPSLDQAWQQGAGNLREALLSLVTSQVFVQRRALPGEVMP